MRPFLLSPTRNLKFLRSDNNFTGYAVISNLDGTLRHIWRYENGTSIRTVNLVPLTPEEAEKWQGTRIKTMGKAPKSAFTRSLDSEADPFLPPIPGGDDKGGENGDDFGLDDRGYNDYSITNQYDTSFGEQNARDLVDQMTYYDMSANMMLGLGDALQNTDNTTTFHFTQQKPSGHETYSGATEVDANGNINCGIYENSFGSMFEETTHAYQLTHSTHTNSANYEMEAKAIAYEFYLETGIPPDNGNLYDYKAIYNYTNGEASAKQAERALGRLGYDNAQSFDETTFHTENLDNLRQ
jgi:hypothetical protein